MPGLVHGASKLTSFYAINNIVKALGVKELANDVGPKGLTRAGVVLERAIVGDSGDKEASTRDPAVNAEGVINLLQRRLE